MARRFTLSTSICGLHARPSSPDRSSRRSGAACPVGRRVSFLPRSSERASALEVRLLVDSLLDANSDALIVVCGDFNADVHEVPVRTIRGDEEDAGNPHLAARTGAGRTQPRRLSPVLGRAPRTSADARSLAGLATAAGLVSERRNPQRGTWRRTGNLACRARQSRSFHAPVVAEFGAPRSRNHRTPPFRLEVRRGPRDVLRSRTEASLPSLPPWPSATTFACR